MTKLQDLLLLAALSICGTGFAADGESLINSRCLQCHKGGAASLSSNLETVKQALTSGSIRKHRFSLSTAEIEALTTYIATVKGQ